MNRNYPKAIIMAGCICCTFFVACDTSAPPDPMVKKQDVVIPKPGPVSTQENVTAEATTFPVGKGGWGYRVIRNGKPYIYQDNIPSIGGKIAFATQEDAKKVGDWVAYQIQHGKPFDVSKVLLDSFKVKH